MEKLFSDFSNRSSEAKGNKANANFKHFTKKKKMQKKKQFNFP
jgi:hypothetical protein